MGLFNNEDEESNDDFMKRLNAQLDSQGPEIDPDSDPLPIEQVVAAPQEAPSVAAPVVGKSFSMPASDIVRPSAKDIVDKRIADLARQKIEQSKKREGLVQEVQDADSSVINNILSAISGFGAGIAGRDAGAAFDSARKIGSSRANRALSEFDKQIEEDRRNRADESEVRAEGRLEKADARKESDRLIAQQLLKEKRDPNSEASRAAQQIIVDQYGFDPAKASKMSAERVEALFPHLKFKIENTYKQAKEAAAAEERAIDNARAERAIDAQLANAAASRAIALSGRQESAARDQRDFADKQEEQAKLSDSQIRDLNEAASVISDYENLAKVATPQVLGVQGAVTPGLLNKDKAKFNTAYDRAKGRDLKSIFGAITSSDVGLSQSAFPDPLTGADSFKSNLNELTNNAKAALKRTLDTLEASGKDVSKIRKQLGLDAPAPKTGGTTNQPGRKTEVKRQRNKRTGEERIVYSDGSVEVVK
jgi:hypothetical protein